MAIECDVCIGGSDGEPVEDLKILAPKSKGKETCDECEGLIPKGASFTRVKGRCEGDKLQHDICDLCKEISVVFGCGEAVPMGSLWYDMEEYAFPRLTTASKCFRALTPAAKQFVLDRWKAWKFKGKVGA